MCGSRWKSTSGKFRGILSFAAEQVGSVKCQQLVLALLEYDCLLESIKDPKLLRLGWGCSSGVLLSEAASRVCFILQVCGVIFFSAETAEQLLATHVTPPLDACTYLGLDSGAPPIQVRALPKPGEQIRASSWDRD